MPTLNRADDEMAIQEALAHLASTLPGPTNGTYKTSFLPVAAAMKQIGFTENEVADWARSTRRGEPEYTWSGLPLNSDDPVAVIIGIAKKYGFTRTGAPRYPRMACAAGCGKFMFARYYDWHGHCLDCADARRQSIDDALDAALALHQAERYPEAYRALQAIVPETEHQVNRHARGLKATTYWIARTRATN